MIQDTHFTQAQEKYIKIECGYECFFSNFNSQCRGVATFINNNFDCKINTVEHDNEGNLLIIVCKLEGKNIAIVNIYGLNRDNPDFYKELQNRLSKYDNCLFILAGEILI